jgi:hypothetical protein
MDLNEKIAALGAIPGTEGPWVTVTLDVSKSGRVPKSTSLFLREALDSETGSPARRGPQAIRLRAAASRIRHHVDATLRPETEGLYLTTDGSTVNSLELLVPLRNSFSVGPRPAVAPLVESGRRWPPTLIARFDERRVEILEFDGGIVSEVRVLRAPKVDQDVEGAVVGARAGRHGLRVSGAGSGGDRRDRFQQRRDEGVEKMFRLAAGMIATWGRRRPAGKRLMLEGSASLRSLLIRQFSGIKIRTLPSAAAPRRNPAALLSGIKAALREDYDAEVRERLAEFHARRATGTGLVLGPEGTLRAMEKGRLERLFVRSDDPIPGRRCTKCPGIFAGSPDMCPYCGEAVLEASVTEEVLRHALRHDLRNLTFVPASEEWLAAVGGMAALLKS